MSLFKSKWVWIAIVILVLVGLVYAGGKWQTAKYEKAMADLKQSNEDLQQDTKTKEKAFLQRINDTAAQSKEIQVKLDRLQKDYVSLERTHQALQIESSKLEIEYEKLKDRFAAIQVPSDRAGRVALFRKFGY